MWIIRCYPLSLLVLEASSNISLTMKASSRHYPHIDNGIGIDGDVCRNSNRQLPFVVCRPRKTILYFLFPFAANKQQYVVFCFLHLQQTNGICRFPLDSFSICSGVSTEMDFCNSAEVGIFSELVFTSLESHRIQYAKFRRMDMHIVLKNWGIIKFCEKKIKWTRNGSPSDFP